MRRRGRVEPRILMRLVMRVEPDIFAPVASWLSLVFMSTDGCTDGGKNLRTVYQLNRARGRALRTPHFFTIAAQRTALQAVSDCFRNVSPDPSSQIRGVWRIASPSADSDPVPELVDPTTPASGRYRSVIPPSSTLDPPLPPSSRQPSMIIFFIPTGSSVKALRRIYRNATTTWGNNVFAQENWEGRNAYPKETDKSEALEEAQSYINTTAAQLSYTSKIIHDLYYRYCIYNFGRGGEGNDAVIANAQDGSGYNNANFMTPPDSQNGWMRMYLWNTAIPYRDGDFEAGIVIHEYSYGLSTRLTGGPLNSGCLPFGESGGMGEGWGDFLATTIRSTANYSARAQARKLAHLPARTERDEALPPRILQGPRRDHPRGPAARLSKYRLTRLSAHDTDAVVCGDVHPGLGVCDGRRALARPPRVGGDLPPGDKLDGAAWVITRVARGVPSALGNAWVNGRVEWVMVFATATVAEAWQAEDGGVPWSWTYRCAVICLVSSRRSSYLSTSDIPLLSQALSLLTLLLELAPTTTFPEIERDLLARRLPHRALTARLARHLEFGPFTWCFSIRRLPHQDHALPAIRHSLWRRSTAAAAAYATPDADSPEYDLHMLRYKGYGEVVIKGFGA
ncbi:Fungalysin metallopeptidase-domain-containing protein [Mycena galericulata]|nr:Fungalysin metallopeptidase-domain-containing protein [Mycena galericulata]